MQIYLPIAEMAVPAEYIFLLGIFVGFISGVFGVGGGFMTTPLLIFMGIPSPVAVATQASQLVATGISGVMGYWRRDQVDFLMGTVMLVGGVIGTVIGILFFKFIQFIGQIDLVIALMYIILMGFIGVTMLFESLFSVLRKRTMRAEFNRLRSPPLIARLPYKMRFPRSKLYVSALVPAGVGLVGGFLVSVMGIGGGFLIVPAMIYIIGMPTLIVAGTSLFQVVFTSAFATILHALTSHSVDIVLAIFLIAGGAIGSQAGVFASKKISGAKARIILALMVLGVCSQLSAHLFLRPENLYEVVVSK